MDWAAGLDRPMDWIAVKIKLGISYKFYSQAMG